ncbi:ferredoxin, partial [Sulfolobus sp. SCGC AB-777_G05]
GPFRNEPELPLEQRFAERTGAIDQAPDKVLQDAQQLGLTPEDLRTYKRNNKNVLPL